jgi:hypothetical protein
MWVAKFKRISLCKEPKYYCASRISSPHRASGLHSVDRTMKRDAACSLCTRWLGAFGLNEARAQKRFAPFYHANFPYGALLRSAKSLANR